MGKTEDKKYYWIQMPKNWLDTTILKLIKREAGEDAFKYTYIYIWLLLRTTETNGYLYFEHELKTIEKQIAVEMDQPNVIETDSISKLFKILDECNAIKIHDDYIFMTKLPEMVGSETAKAEYMRQKRKNKKNDNENNVPENSENRNNVLQSGTTENNVLEINETRNDVLQNGTVENNVPENSENRNNVLQSGTTENNVLEINETRNDVLQNGTVENNVPENSENRNNVLQNGTTENNVLEINENRNNVLQSGTTENNVPHSNSNNKSNSNTSNDDDRVGKIPAVNDKYNLVPKTDEDYQALVDEMLSVDPFERPDLVTSVDEEKGLIDEMFHSYDGQKVIRAMKKGKDNGAKSFTYARQILQSQGESSSTPSKESNEKLVIPCDEWDEMLRKIKSAARKDILEETAEEFRAMVLGETKFYTVEEITDALREARVEFEESFEGDEKVYSYFQFILKYKKYLQKEAVANNVDPQTFILKKFNSLWEKQQE